MNALLVLFIAGASLGVPRPPCGCSPSVTGADRMSMVDDADRYHAIFVGYVARVDTVPIGTARVGPPPGGLRHWKRYHVSVVRAWRAPGVDTTLFRGGVEVMSSCDPPLRLGRTYLLFAAPSGDPGYWRVNHCMAAELHRVTDVVDSLDRRRWPRPENQE